MTRRSADPFAPIDTAARFLLALYSVALVVGVVMTVIGKANLFSWRTNVLCVNDPNEYSAVTLPDLKPGVTAAAQGVTVCTPNPSLSQHLLTTLAQAPNYLLFIAVLLTIWLLIRDAKRNGLYTARMAQQLRWLGWLLGLGSLTVMVIQGEANSYLAASMVHTTSPLTNVDYWQVPTVTLLTALGVLSFARIMRIGTTMREDLDGTV
jgi:hypothetical protein